MFQNACDMVEPIFEYQFRVILIGNSMVGKSSLLKYFTVGRCPDITEATVGVDFFCRLVEVEPGIKIKLQLWDTAGQERFRSITRTYYRNSVGVLMVYDITSRESFEDMLDWLHEALEYIDSSKSVFLVVGQKADMEEERAVSYGDGRRFADANGLDFIETSAVTGQNVDEAFVLVARKIYEKLKDGRLRLEDGWDGIKRGFGHGGRPPVLQGRFQITDGGGDDDEESSGTRGGGCCP